MLHLFLAHAVLPSPSGSRRMLLPLPHPASMYRCAVLQLPACLRSACPLAQLLWGTSHACATGETSAVSSKKTGSGHMAHSGHSRDALAQAWRDQKLSNAVTPGLGKAPVQTYRRGTASHSLRFCRPSIQRWMSGMGRTEIFQSCCLRRQTRSGHQQGYDLVINSRKRPEKCAIDRFIATGNVCVDLGIGPLEVILRLPFARGHTASARTTS